MYKASGARRLRLLPALLAAAPGLPPASGAEGRYDEMLRNFEGNSAYVRPLATLFGSIANSGWSQGASVGRGFGFYFGLPVSLVSIADEDRTYRAVHVDDGCVLYHQDQPDGGACRDRVTYSAPTLFGRGRAPTLERSNYNPNSGTFGTPMEVPVSDGEPAAADFNWLPFVAPQLGVNLFHTEAKVRYIGMPPIAGLSFQVFGFGLQHDLRSFLPHLPVNLSLSGSLSWISAAWEPGGNVDGSLELGGFSHFVGLVAGHDFLRRMEAFLELGWEGATLESGGRMVVDEGEPDEETIRPGLTLEGRNGFRASLNLAFHFGYQAVVGQSFGANLGQSLNLLGFRLE